VAAFGVTSSRASFMLLPLVAALFVGSPLAGRLLDRLGSRVVIIGGTALTALGALVLSFAGSSMAGYYTAGVLVGLGLSALLGAPIRYVMINEAPAGDRAAAQAVATVGTSIGQLVGAALVGAVVDSGGGGAGGYTRAFLSIGVVMAVFTLVAFGLKKRPAELADMERAKAAETEAAGAALAPVAEGVRAGA
jgi:MFS family permease